MAVAMNNSWKVPCGYFLTDGFRGEERANLVKESLRRLRETGVHVVSLTCDGPSRNFSRMRALEAELNPSRTDFDPGFLHPSDASLCIQVMIIMDACHMLEQVWNSHGDIGNLFDTRW